MLRSRWFVSTLLPVAMLGLVMACSDDEDSGTPGPGPGTTTINVPAAWGGVWFIESTPTTDRGLQSEFQAMVFCPGTNVVEAFGLFEDPVPDEVTCQGTMGSASSNFTCSASSALNDTCTVTHSVTFIATGPGQGDEVTGTITFIEAYSAQCEGAVNDTTEATFVATRFDNEPPACGVFEDAVPASWGGHWDITQVEVDCDTGEELGDPLSFPGELFCPGESVEDFFDIIVRQVAPELLRQQDLFYIGGFTETSADVFIAGGERDEFGCDVASTVHFEITRTGESFTGTITYRLHVLGGEAPQCEPGEQCLRLSVEATRADTDISECAP